MHMTKKRGDPKDPFINKSMSFGLNSRNSINRAIPKEDYDSSFMVYVVNGNRRPNNMKSCHQKKSSNTLMDFDTIYENFKRSQKVVLPNVSTQNADSQTLKPTFYLHSLRDFGQRSHSMMQGNPASQETKYDSFMTKWTQN